MKSSLTLSFVFALIIFSTHQVHAYTDPKIGGIISIKKEFVKNITPQGVLYVIAKQAGPDSGPSDRTPPVAVIKIDRPTFPQAFVITQKNVMIPGREFTGAFHIIARYSPTGDALTKSGSIEGIDPKNLSVELGNKNLKIELNQLLK